MFHEEEGRTAADAASSPNRGARRGRRRVTVAAAMAAPMLLLAACTNPGGGGGSGGSSSGVGPYAPATAGNGPNGSFYSIPNAPIGALPGQLLYYTPTTSSQISNATGWDVAYVSTDAQGNPDVVTGTVYVPTAKWTGTGPRPLVDYAVGTQGLGASCAPSKQLAAGSEYEAPDITTALGKGYAVALTDYQWSGQQSLVQPYVVGLSEGHAVLDMARVPAQIPGAGVSLSAPTVVWGYSQGGGAAAEAGELWKTYEPGIDLVGVAAGGVPGDLVKVGEALNGSLGAAFLFDALAGFHSAYPSLPFNSLISSAGTTMLQKLETECLTAQLANFSFQKVSQYTQGGLTLQQLLQQQPTWVSTLDQNSPGLPGANIPVPVYMYRGVIDEIIPTTVEDATYANMCKTGTVIQSNTYPGEHLTTDFEAEGDVMTFIANRLSGATPVNDCTSNPTSL